MPSDSHQGRTVGNSQQTKSVHADQGTEAEKYAKLQHNNYMSEEGYGTQNTGLLNGHLHVSNMNY